MQPRRLALFALYVVLSAPAVVRAGQIAVLAPQLKPPGAAELRDRFHDAVTRALAKAGEVVPADEVRSKLASQPDLLNCEGGGCVKRAALALTVERVVTVEVEYVGKDYSIKVHAFDAGGNPLGGVLEEKCDICTVREAARASERAAERALPSVAEGLAKAAPPAPRPAVDAPPVGMTETPSPPKPVTPPPVAPPPAVAVNPTPAPAPPAAPVPVARPAEPAPVAITPVPTPAPASGGDRGGGRSGYRTGAYVAFGVAAAALAATIPFAYYASKQKPNTRGLYTGDGCEGAALPQISCPKIYSGNTAPAVIFGVATGVAAATGAVLLYLDMRHQKRPAATIIGVPTRDGFAVATSVEF